MQMPFEDVGFFLILFGNGNFYWNYIFIFIENGNHVRELNLNSRNNYGKILENALENIWM